MASHRSSAAATFRPTGAVAHHWSGVVGDSISTLCAVGVRCDETERQSGVSIVVDMKPGRLTARTHLPFAVRSVGGTIDDPLFIDEETRSLWHLVGDAPIKLKDEVAWLEGDLIVGRDGLAHRVVRGSLREVARGARGVAAGIVVGEDTVTVLNDDGLPGDTVPFVAPGLVRAVHRREHQIAVYVDKSLHTLDLRSGERRSFTGPPEAHCLARADTGWFIGCTLGGLHCLDDGDDLIRVFRPSLRAHQLTRLSDGFVAVSDLSIAVSDDGVEWLGRDLAGLVRLFDTL